jgi:hypothetical protein
VGGNSDLWETHWLHLEVGTYHFICAPALVVLLLPSSFFSLTRIRYIYFLVTLSFPFSEELQGSMKLNIYESEK